jgi:hypothetical protein
MLRHHEWPRTAYVMPTLHLIYRCLDVAVEDPVASLGTAVAQLSKRALMRILSSDNLKVCGSGSGQNVLHCSSVAVVDIPTDHLVELCCA